MFHIMPYDLYSIYNIAGEAAKRSFFAFSIFLSDCISPESILSYRWFIKKIGVGVWGVFKSRWGLGRVMMESLYIIGVIIAGFGVLAKLLIDLGNQIDDGLVELDEKLALAIKSVVDMIPGMGEHEPINPIQQMVAQLIGQSLQKQDVIIPPKIIERDENGLFSKQG